MKKIAYITPDCKVKALNMESLMGNVVSGGEGNVPIDNNDDGWDDDGFNGKGLKGGSVWDD